MTTKDLKQISELLDERLDNRLAPIKETLDSHTKILDSHTKILDSHTKILDSHTKILDSHTKILVSHTKKHDSHTKMLKKLKGDQTLILNTLDKEQMSQRKRLDRIEEHVGLSTS